MHGCTDHLVLTFKITFQYRVDGTIALTSLLQSQHALSFHFVASRRIPNGGIISSITIENCPFISRSLVLISPQPWPFILTCQPPGVCPHVDEPFIN